MTKETQDMKETGESVLLRQTNPYKGYVTNTLYHRLVHYQDERSGLKKRELEEHGLELIHWDIDPLRASIIYYHGLSGSTIVIRRGQYRTGVEIYGHSISEARKTMEEIAKLKGFDLEEIAANPKRLNEWDTE